MFKITGGEGFHIIFKNGYNVSVQFGPGNYCDNRSSDYSNPEKAGAKGCKNAECAVWADKGASIEHPMFNGDTVGLYMSPEQVLELLNWAASQKGGENE